MGNAADTHPWWLQTSSSWNQVDNLSEMDKSYYRDPTKGFSMPPTHTLSWHCWCFRWNHVCMGCPHKPPTWPSQQQGQRLENGGKGWYLPSSGQPSISSLTLIKFIILFFYWLIVSGEAIMLLSRIFGVGRPRCWWRHRISTLCFCRLCTWALVLWYPHRCSG